MVSSDQIIATLEQPLCVVRKLDQVIIRKNQAFSQLAPNANNHKFGDIFRLFSDKLFNSLNEMSTTVAPKYVQSTRGNDYCFLIHYIQCILSSIKYHPFNVVVLDDDRDTYIYQIFISHCDDEYITVLFIANNAEALKIQKNFAQEQQIDCVLNQFGNQFEHPFETICLSASLDFDEHENEKITNKDAKRKHSFENICLNAAAESKSNQSTESTFLSKKKCNDRLFLTQTSATAVDKYDHDLNKQES